MASRRRAPASYRAAQRAARSVERDLLRRVGAQMDQALERAVQDLVVRLNSLPGSTPELRLRALERAQEIFQKQRNLLIQRLEQAAAAGRRTGFKDVIAVWQEATKAAAKSVGLPNAALGAVLTPRTTMLAAYENVGGAKLFRTLLRRAAQDGYRAVNEVLRVGILEGKSFEKLARELRPWVQGRAGGDLGAAFDTVRFNSQRIAYSEIHNARSEAEVQHFEADPLIEAVAWRLAPDRGTNRGPDACDALAENDFFGLGPGVYPVDRVPLPPHPFDRSLAAWTPVLTRAGWRRVDAIRQGEEVLTHFGRWCRVTESLVGRVTKGWLVLTTEDGRRLTITDDHPVLTASGRWTLAGALRPGDFLVASRDDVDNTLFPRAGVSLAEFAPGVGFVEDFQRPACRQKRGSFARIGGALLRAIMPAAMQFDGKTEVWQRNINVEAAEGVEGDGWDSARAQPRQDSLLQRAKALVTKDGLRAFVARSVGLFRPSEQSDAALGTKAAFFVGHAPADQRIRLGEASPGNAPARQGVSDGAGMDAEAEPQRDTTQLFVDVQADDFVLVRLKHVASLSLSIRRYCLTVANDKSFVAGGIVVHNCERVPITRSLEKANDPKPSPPLTWPKDLSLGRGDGMSDAARRGVERSTRSALQ